jgi:uncharacterized membrane protein YgcG
MVQPKYSPEEALQRIKLMMEYDTSKTLNENVETIKQPINEIAPLLGFIPMALPWLIGYGTAAAAGIGTWIYNVQGGGDAFSKAQTFFAGCSSLDKNLKPLQSKGDHREAADSIYNAIEGIGTDEDAIKGAISSMESVADLCAMYKYYNKTYGDLYSDLDGDLDGESFRRYVWSAIAPIVDDAEENLEQAKKEKGGGGKSGGGTGGGTGGYKSCSGTYEKGCKSDTIAKVQGCLGLVADGKFGPKTLAALSGKGFSKFTDADVTKICEKTTTVVEPEISGEVQSINGNSDF